MLPRDVVNILPITRFSDVAKAAAKNQTSGASALVPYP